MFDPAGAFATCAVAALSFAVGVGSIGEIYVFGAAALVAGAGAAFAAAAGAFVLSANC